MRARIDRLGSRVWPGFNRALPYILPAVASLLVVCLSLPFLKGSHNRATDESFHQSNSHAVALALSEGRNPIKFNPVNLGVPGFRTYQVLHYMVAGTIEFISGLPTMHIQNWLMILLFASSPWAYRRFYLVIGLHPVAAGVGSLLVVTSMGGFTNSFEAYFRLGVVTQAGASVLLPLTLAAVMRLVQGGKNYLAAGVLMGMTVLAHVMFAVYAALGALIIVMVCAPASRGIWKRLIAAAVLATVLSSFWVLPFISLQEQLQPIPDSVILPYHNYFYVVYSPAQLDQILGSGRLLDGGRADGSKNDSLEARMNQESQLRGRFPFVTVLALTGVAFALAGFKRKRYRIILTGFTLGLLFMLGRDDVEIFSYIPLINKTQLFRMAYFTELFAFALGGIAVHRIGCFVVDGLVRLSSKKSHLCSLTTRLVLVAVSISLIGLLFASTVRMITPYMDSWEANEFSEIISILQRGGPPDPHKRVIVQYGGNNHFRRSLNHVVEIRGNFITACHHWGLLTSATNTRVCRRMSKWYSYPALARVTGMRYLVSETAKSQHLIAPDSPTASDYETLGHFDKHTILQDRKAAMLHDVAGERILVVATHAQWTWLLDDWLNRFAGRVNSAGTPVLLRISPDELADSGLIGFADAVIYLDDSNIEKDRPYLKRVRKEGKPLLLGMALEGIEGITFKMDDKDWITSLGLRGSNREAAGAKIKRVDTGKPADRLSFEVSADKSALLMLSMEYFVNWQATLNGKPITTMAAVPDLVAVRVPPGEHRLEFQFESTPLEKWTLIVSLLGWISMLGLGIFFTSRRGIALAKSRKKGR